MAELGSCQPKDSKVPGCRSQEQMLEARAELHSQVAALEHGKAVGSEVTCRNGSGSLNSTGPFGGRRVGFGDSVC